MQITDPRPAAPDAPLDSPIVASTVDEVVHYVLDPGERVKTFCFAQRLVHSSDLLFTAVVLAERQLLLIRPADNARYSLEAAERTADCSLVTTSRRKDGSTLLVIRTPSDLLRLYVDPSWLTQADTLIEMLTPAEPRVELTHAVSQPPSDGISLEGDIFAFSQEFAGLHEQEDDIDDY